MTKLKTDENTLKHKIIPNLEEAANKLRLAIKCGENLTIPNDFKQKQKLEGVLENNILLLKKINFIADWIYESNTHVDNVLGHLEEELRTIKRVEVKNRENIVKKL